MNYNQIKARLEATSYWGAFEDNFTVKVGSELSIIGSKLSTGFDFQQWLHDNNITGVFSATETQQIVDALNNYHSTIWHQLRKVIWGVAGGQPFFNTHGDVLKEAFDRLLTQDPASVKAAEEFIYSEYDKAIASCDMEPLHERANRLSVLGVNDEPFEAVELTHYYNPDFWATSEKVRNAFIEQLRKGIIVSRYVKHLDKRIKVHTDPTTGKQTWLENGDLLIRRKGKTDFVPVTKELASLMRLTVQTPQY